jgi:uncharacterized membrane-anchored protein YhcB (DUF1043 family)
MIYVWLAAVIIGGVGSVINNQQAKQQAQTQAEIDQVQSHLQKVAAINANFLAIIKKQEADLQVKLAEQKKQSTLTIVVTIATAIFCGVLVKWALKK